MKTLITCLLILSFFVVAIAEAQTTPNLKKEFQTLGDNKDVVERVKNMDTQQRVRIVQNRMVDRNNRIELSISYGGLFGADSYVKTSNLGGQLQYHLTPHWSFGLEYQKASNSLNDEGQRQYDLAYACQKSQQGCTQRFAGVDFPLETKMASVSFYPIYGKLNLFDSGIAQFDVYTLLGYGKKTLNSGESDVFAAGLGIGVWINQHFTTRFEARYENYQDLLTIKPRTQNAVTLMASVGVLVW